VLYYVIFRIAITRFDRPTPGRESDEEIEELEKAQDQD
jgi:PTS system N-acetylglucosamine-specific IIC component